MPTRTKAPPQGAFFHHKQNGAPMPFDPAFDDDSQPWWQPGPPLRITVHPNPPASKPSGNRNESDGIDDWIVPGNRRDDDSYPDDWIVPGEAAAADPYPDDWITPPRARDDASYPDDWIVPARSASANRTQTPPNFQSAINPSATPVPGSPGTRQFPFKAFGRSSRPAWSAQWRGVHPSS
jgi:hypothetical protein